VAADPAEACKSQARANDYGGHRGASRGEMLNVECSMLNVELTDVLRHSTFNIEH
jgi:hypothetical protein